MGDSTRNTNDLKLTKETSSRENVLSGFFSKKKKLDRRHKTGNNSSDMSAVNVFAPNEQVVSDTSPSQTTQATYLKKDSVLNCLKDQVIRIVLLSGDEQKSAQTTDLLNEVDDAMKKSKLFTMTQIQDI